MPSLPRCPRPGHESRRVVRDGTYGKRARQRFRCWAPDGKAFHRFVPPVPRQVATLGVCDTCDNRVHRHEGPTVQRRGLYEVREIAEALRSIAQGTTYTEAARRVRRHYWGKAGSKSSRKATTVESGQVVAEWLHQFGPVIAAPWAETEWPECLVLDSTEFQHLNPKTGRKEQLFVVLAAWGYPAGTATGRLWRLEAHPSDKGANWREFLEGLPGRPRSAVCDRDYAILDGVRQRWGTGKNAVPTHLCEHHLRVNAMKALSTDNLSTYGSALPTLLRNAFHSLAEWDAFATAVAAEPNAATTQRWVSYWDKNMRVQTARRPALPAHYSTGAVEAPIRDVRQLLERRRWTFRNRKRMNLLLELVRLRLNRHDDPARWAALIRAHIDQADGQSAYNRRVADPITYDPASGERIYSLRP